MIRRDHGAGRGGCSIQRLAGSATAQSSIDPLTSRGTIPVLLGCPSPPPARGGRSRRGRFLKLSTSLRRGTSLAAPPAFPPEGCTVVSVALCVRAAAPPTVVARERRWNPT